MTNKDIDAEVMAGLSGEERANFKKGLASLGMVDPEDRAALRASFKRSRPDASERELDILVTGQVPKDNKREWIQ